MKRNGAAIPGFSQVTQSSEATLNRILFLKPEYFVKIIQITDLHLVPPGKRLHGIDPAARLQRIVADLLVRHADADLVVITGDLCNDGDPLAYAFLAETLAALNCSVRLLLGNHDARPAFRAAFPDHPCDPSGFVQSVCDTPHGRLLFLDSHEPGMIGGCYCSARAAWLAEAVRGAGAKPLTVFIHHPPVPDDIAHFTQIGLHDKETIMAILRAHPGGLRHIVFGHIHIAMTGVTVEGIPFSSGQSCAQRLIVDLNDPAPLWTGGAPCYRILLLDEAGLRVYSVALDQPEIGRTNPCPGP